MCACVSHKDECVNFFFFLCVNVETCIGLKSKCVNLYSTCQYVTAGASFVEISFINMSIVAIIYSRDR